MATPYGLANQKLCYIQMLLNIEKSGEQGKERSLEWLVNSSIPNQFCRRQTVQELQQFYSFVLLFSDEMFVLPVLHFCLTHYHTMPHFDALKIYCFGKHCEKRRNCFWQAVSPFLTMFSTLCFFFFFLFSFRMHFKMSSAIYFHLDQSKILLSSNGLT